MQEVWLHAFRQPSLLLAIFETNKPKTTPLTNLVHFAIKFGNLRQSLILWAADSLILDTKKQNTNLAG